jgi:hypothetical protein
MMETIQCPHCGWQNEMSAVMCGGCGQLLRTEAATPSGTRASASWSAAQRDPAAAASSDLPTLYGTAAPAPVPSRGARTGGPAAAAPAWPGGPGAPASGARRKRSGGLAGVALALVLSLAVLVALGAAAWGLFIRPAIHAQVDAAISSALNAAIATVPPVPEQALLAVGSKITVSQDETNAVLRRELPQNSGLDSASVVYQPGVVELLYSAYGQSGTIDTSLQVRNKQVVATNTHVSGLLGWVESGPELESTLNQAFGQLQTKTPHGFQSVQIGTGQLTVILRTS